MAIEYRNKGWGMHEAVAAAGYVLRFEGGEWISNDDVAVQAIMDGYALDAAKAAKAAEVSLIAKILRDTVTASISAGEMASWPIKRAEAEEYGRLGDTASCPSLRLEASARGVSLEALVAKVQSNAARFIGAETAIGGADGRHRDAISALTTFEAVASYDYQTGWPVI